MVAVLIGVSVTGAENPATSASQSNRTVSEKIAREVAEKLPKYNPPAATNGPSLTPENSNSSPDVLQLPKITVTADAPTAPPDWAMVPPEERLKRAMKTNPGIQVGNFFGLNSAYAMTIQREERDVQKKAALSNAVQRTRSDDSQESRRIDQLLKAALVRPSTGWTKGANEYEADIIDRKKSSRRK